MASYSYTVASNFSIFNLGTSIRNSTITAVLSGISLNPSGSNNLSISFLNSLSAGEKTTLDGFVTNNNSVITPLQSGNAYKFRVRVATTTSGTLSTSFAAGQVIDGVTLAIGDRILIKDQTNQVENGIYRVNSSGAPSRDNDLAIGKGAATVTITVNQGTINAHSIWICDSIIGSDIVGTNNLSFTIPSGTVGGINNIFDFKSQGVNGGTFTSGAWRTRNLNSVTGNGPATLVGVSGATGFNLPAGSYQINATVPAYKVGSHQSRLFNVTSNSTVVYGQSSFSNTSTNTATTNSPIYVYTTLSVPSLFVVQHRCSTTETSDGFGLASNFTGNNEVYTQVQIMQYIN